jgi:glucosamine--fructose-6-phosphate aminotransferase (isomerizing)
MPVGGKTIIEHLTRIPVEVMFASYSGTLTDRKTAILFPGHQPIGETADTLHHGGGTAQSASWDIVNAIGSQAMRSADGAIAMQVGPEIGVASTKAFTAPLVDLYMLAVYLADLRGNINPAKRFELIRDLLMVPTLAGKTLEHEPEVEKAAAKYKDMRSVLYLGRGINMPIAYEGARN